MRIAVFDYRVEPTNPVGGCHLHVLESLCDEHDFTVFAVDFENPRPDRITSVRVPAVRRPLAALFVSFHLLAPLVFWWHKIRSGRRYDLVQSVESNLFGSDLVYSQFCHRAYLDGHRPPQTGGLGARIRLLDNQLHARAEPHVYARARYVVANSRGLGRELVRLFPALESRLVVIPNAVEVDRLRPPDDFDRAEWRTLVQLPVDAVVLLFVSLGHYERKGLPELLDAAASFDDVHLLVVGGLESQQAPYRREVERRGLEHRVTFVPTQRDLRPFYWGADAFVFPSHYETFSLVSHEAAAAGLPVIAPAFHGLEDLLVDGENGFVIEPTVTSVRTGIKRFLALDSDQRRSMGRRAASAARSVDVEHFTQGWRALYESLAVGDG